MTVTLTDLNLTPASLDLMNRMVKNSADWSGTPPLFNHVTKETRGNLTQLKRKGLVTTFKSNGEEWVEFTPLARQLFTVSEG